MMSGSDWGHNMAGGYGFIGALMWFILFIDLVLLGIWLWQQISKK